MGILIRSNGQPRLIYLHHVFPLRILKQIITMCFSVNSSKWGRNHPELEEFVLNRNRHWMNPRYRTFVYYNIEGQFRRLGDGIAHINLNKSSKVIQVTEITHPPFGYVFTVDGSCPDERLCEISHFQRYEYSEFEVAPLYLPTLPTHIPIPLDYRTGEEIREQARENELAQR